MTRSMSTARFRACCALLLVGAASLHGAAGAHTPFAPATADATEGMREIVWQAPGISRVLTQGWVDTLGISFVWPRPEQAGVQTIEGRSCLVGGFFSFDVDNHFAFDIDEDVEIELEIDTHATPSLLIDYDHNGATRPPRRLDFPAGSSRWHRETIRLERARFADLGQYRTDIAIAAPGAAVTADPTVAFDPSKPHSVTICNMTLKRSLRTAAAPATGSVEIVVRDDEGAITPSRMGLYDASGKAPLPSDDAIPVKRYGDQARLIRLRFWGPGGTETWFNDNRWIFYSGGEYRASLPAGTYELVVAKGPEYRVRRETITVAPGEARKVELSLERWADPAQEGWVSGDDHVHMDRQPEDNDAILTLAEAEDVKVMNMLRMGNLHGTTFEQYAYGKEGQATRGAYALVSGQEDPRSGQRGHTLHLNIAQPVRADDYFAYHEVFEAVRRQGAVSGYAHFGEGHFNDRRGIALDAPFDLVDIAEVLQSGSLNLGAWYDFLNLGFKIAPSAGAAWPYSNLPGAERVYVQTGGGTDLPGWYEGLKAGRSFVTSGPLLRFEVNGAVPGAELTLEPGQTLRVRASARQNPDYDALDRIELVANGEVIHSVKAGAGEEVLTLDHAFIPKGGCWLAIRAYGRGYVKAHSAPVYAVVGGDPSWRRADVPSLAEAMGKAVRELEALPPNALLELEYWDTHKRFEAEWKRQLPVLVPRIRAAEEYYETLSRRARDAK